MRLRLDGVQGTMPSGLEFFAEPGAVVSAIRLEAGGRASTTRQAPLWLLSGLPTIGRPSVSQTAYSLEFSPPLMRPIQRGTSPFLQR